MKRFLIHLTIWLAAAFVLAVALDAMITAGLRKADLRKYCVWNDIYNGKINADLLVMGSSRAWSGYNTYILDSLLKCNSYNIGIEGHHFGVQMIRYTTYRRFNRKPSVIVLNTDFLSTLSNSAESQYELEQYFPYICDTALCDAVAADNDITWLERYCPLLRYFGYRDDIAHGIESFFGRKHFSDGGLYKGYRGNDWHWNRASLADDNTHYQVDISAEIVGKLEDFVEAAEEEGIQVVFVKAPFYRPLLERFSDVARATDSIFVSIADRHQVPILDYYYSPVGLDSTNFYNPSHLNAKGAEIFTTELCRDLEGVALSRPSCSPSACRGMARMH